MSAADANAPPPAPGKVRGRSPLPAEGTTGEDLIRRYARQTLDGDGSVSAFVFPQSKRLPVDDVIHQYAQAKTRAIRLAQIVESEDDDVASLLTQKQPSALQDTHHAILLDAYDAANGNLRFLVTATQFQAMAGDTGVKLRPFFKSGHQKSLLAELE